MKTEARRWQLQDAKNRLSELVIEAERSGPQIVTRRGVDTAVLVSAEDYRKLTQKKRARTLVDVLLAAPKVPGGLSVERDRDPGRDVDLG